jgi:hypothetical protein
MVFEINPGAIIRQNEYATALHTIIFHFNLILIWGQILLATITLHCYGRFMHLLMVLFISMLYTVEFQKHGLPHVHILV